MQFLKDYSFDQFRVDLHEFCNYIPIISTFTNTLAVIQKRMYVPDMDKDGSLVKSHYYRYLKEQDFEKNWQLFIPVANTIFCINKSCFPEKKEISVEEILSINERIRQQLPKHVFSKVGSLGDGHLECFLDQEKPENYEEIIKWAFSQRKFQARGSNQDTIFNPSSGVALDSKNSVWINDEGYAMSMSAHPADEMIFIPDSEIKRVDSCVGYEFKKIDQGKRLIIGHYQDGTHIIHQPGVRSCGPTCLAMVLLDKKVPLELIQEKSAPFHLSHLVMTNLSNDEELKWWVNSVGYELIDLKTPVSNSVEDLSDIQKGIEKYGPLLVTISDKGIEGIGGHKIVVDSINSDEVTIRDPIHGWRITIETNLLLQNMNPRFKGICLKTF